MLQSLDQVVAFTSVYENQSYSAAGRQLRKDRTTVRELVKAYEDQLGFGLFIIVGRKAEPTERAIKLYPQAKLVLRQNQVLQQFGQAMFVEPKVEVHLGYDRDFPTELLADIERRCLEKFPQIRAHWKEVTRIEGLKALQDHTLDIAVLPAKGKVTPHVPCAFRHLGYISYGVYVHPLSHLAGKDDFSLEDAQFEVQYLMDNHLYGEGMIQAFSNLTRGISSYELLVKLLENGGWTFLPLSVGQNYVRQNKLKKVHVSLLSNDVKVPFSLFYPIGGDSHPVTQALIDWFTEISMDYFQ